MNQNDLDLYLSELGRLNMVRIWNTANADYAKEVADEAIMDVKPGQIFINFINGKISEKTLVDSLVNKIGKAKQQYPFITHIEAFNEMKLEKGQTIKNTYYRGYRAFYLAIRKLNRLNNYEKPLLLGGMACMWVQYERGYLKDFLKCYGEDTDPEKQLDFVSAHIYPGTYENHIAYRKTVEKYFSDYKIKPVKLIMTELGWKQKGADKKENKPDEAILWATGALSNTYQFAEQNIIPMHWVYPSKEDQYTMAISTGKNRVFTPKGNAIKLAQMLEDIHVKSTISIDKEGRGIYSVASYDDSGVAILIWNFDSKNNSTKTVKLHLQNSEIIKKSSGMVTEYLLDNKHANYFYDPNAWKLSPISENTQTLESLQDKKIVLKGNAIYMLKISFE